MNPDVPLCPQCGAALTPGAALGLCARCLLAGAAEPTDAGTGAPVATPPTVEQVAAAFPQLEVLALIGAGGMGAVFRARQPKLNRLVALKVLPATLVERDAAFAERFEREGQMLARLHHPNIVAVYDSGRAGDFFYLLMEHVDGVNLRQAMRASRFTPAQALGIVPRICDALQFAHEEGVLHRDIKPENILLDAKGRVKLADFGIGKLVGDGTHEPHATHATHASHPSLTQLGTTLGTPQYMAPEQREQPELVDHRADIYSLGVVFYELLTGELPVGKFAPPSQLSASDPRVDAIVRQALEKERDRRQQSAGEVRTQVETVAREPKAVALFSTRKALAVGCGLLLLIIGLPMVVLLSSYAFWTRASVPSGATAKHRAEMARQESKMTGVQEVPPAAVAAAPADLENAFKDYELLLTALRETTFELDLADIGEGSEADRERRRADIERKCHALADQTARLRERILALGSRAAAESRPH